MLYSPFTKVPPKIKNIWREREKTEMEPKCRKLEMKRYLDKAFPALERYRKVLLPSLHNFLFQTTPKDEESPTPPVRPP